MRIRRIFWVVPFGLCLATGALARQAAPSEPPAITPPAPPQPSLSPQEMLEQSRQSMTKIRQIESRILALQDQARKKRDILKLNCLNDKLLQVRGLLTVATQSVAELDTAVAANDVGGIRHQFTRMTILHEKAIVLATEGENCVGEDASYVGATRVDVEIDPNIPEEDPTQPQLPLPDVTRPPAASPFV